MSNPCPPKFQIFQSDLRHFKKRWNERYGTTIGKFDRSIRKTILDKIYYGESERVRISVHGRRLLSVEAVTVNGRAAFVLYDERIRDLFSAVPTEDGFIRRFIASKNYQLRQQNRKELGLRNDWNTLKGQAKKKVVKKSGVAYF